MLEEPAKSAEKERRKILQQAIPEAFVDGKLDLDLMSEILEEMGVQVLQRDRRAFSWAGKTKAIHAVDSPPRGTLEAVPEESLNYEKTKNVFIEGDNLETLKLLQKTMQNRVKLIYIDPPYNAKGTSLYTKEFRNILGNYGSTKRDHSRWLSMMYPRIFLARNLLRDDGVMFVSIDDGEVYNLRMIMDEIFGEENVEIMIWKKVDSNEGKLKLVKRFRIEHEYILVGYKNKEKCLFRKVNELPRFKNPVENVDGDPRGDWVSGNMSSTEAISVEGGKNYYAVTSPGGRKFVRQWKFPSAEFDRLNREDRIYWGKNGNNVPRLKVFAKEPRSVYVSSIIEEKGTAKSAAAELFRLVGADCFPNPKPVKLVQYLIDAAQTQHGIVMDFFAGSGTTAQAVLAQNALDGGNRSFLLVQLPESLEHLVSWPSEGRLRFHNIAEVTRCRVIAAIADLKRSPTSGTTAGSELDLGMRVFRVAMKN